MPKRLPARQVEPDLDELAGPTVTDPDMENQVVPPRKPISPTLNSLKSALASRRGPQASSPLAKMMARKNKRVVRG